MAALDVAIVVLYLGVTLGLGFLRRPEDTGSPARGHYLLAGRRLTLPAFVATTVSTFYGGVLGVGEYSYDHGLSNWLVFGVPYYLYGAVFALFLAGRACRSQALTLPDRIRAVHGPGPGLLASVVVLVTSLPAAYLLELGLLTREVFGGSLEVSASLMTLFSVLYVWRGGFRTIIRTGFLQFACMYGGFALILGILVGTRGGLSFLQTSVPPGHWTWHGGLPAQSIVLWYLIASSTLVEPTFYQHCFAASSPSVARRGIAWSIAFWVLFDAMTTFTGLYARALVDLQDTPSAEAYPRLARAVLPPGLLGVFLVALLATVMSTVEGYLFVAASTLGRDVLGRLGRFRDREATATRWALVMTAAASLAIALAARSVVRLWHHMGTISTATLLFPVLGAFWPRLRLSPRRTLLQMATVLVVTTFWLASRYRGDDGTYLLGIEPIYLGFAVGAAFFLGPRGSSRTRVRGPDPRTEPEPDLRAGDRTPVTPPGAT